MTEKRWKEDVVKRALEPLERDMPNPPDEQPLNAGADDPDIDRILADSFPASDSPPWTLGVTHLAPKKRVTNRKPRDR